MSYDPERIPELARQIRSHTLRMVHASNASHVGSCFSMADILAVLYGSVLRVNPAKPDWTDRDRFIVSKGHAAAAVYATLAECGFFPKHWLDTYAKDGTKLSGHVSHHGVPGVDHSTGSLGHGLSVACGMALAAKRNRRPHRAFCLLSDGECDEGSVWEAILFAPHHKLDNLVAIVDFNKLQSFGRVKDVLSLDPFADKWKSFGWEVQEIDGHDHEALHERLSKVPFREGKPSCLIAHTTKGKGVSYMEDRLEWHYKSPNDAQLAIGLAEVGAIA